MEGEGYRAKVWIKDSRGRENRLSYRGTGGEVRKGPGSITVGYLTIHLTPNNKLKIQVVSRTLWTESHLHKAS